MAIATPRQRHLYICIPIAGKLGLYFNKTRPGPTFSSLRTRDSKCPTASRSLYVFIKVQLEYTLTNSHSRNHLQRLTSHRTAITYLSCLFRLSLAAAIFSHHFYLISFVDPTLLTSRPYNFLLSASLQFTLGFIYTATLVFFHWSYDLSTAFGIHYLGLPTLHDEIQSQIAHEWVWKMRVFDSRTAKEMYG
jgi:hypothetical protein